MTGCNTRSEITVLYRAPLVLADVVLDNSTDFASLHEPASHEWENLGHRLC